MLDLPDMSLSAWAASPCTLLLLHACFFILTAMVVVVVSTTASASASVPLPVADQGRDGANTTTTTMGSSAVTSTTTTPSSSAEIGWDWNHYYCFLCTGRHPLLIHYCPIYWDECHLNCWDETSSSTTTTTTAIPIPDEAASSSSPPPPPPADDDTVQGKDCYVMKLYMGGNYVIIQNLSCDGVASCFLTCGGGELAAPADRRAVAGTTTKVPATLTAAIQQGSFVPFDLCNTELSALPRAPPSPLSAGGGGGVPVPVPAGGARRRRSS